MKYRKMLGETIYNLRTAKGLSQSELGALVGVSNKAVSKWETDEANPDISLLPRLAEIFDITIDELLKEIKVESLERKNPHKRVGGFMGSEKESPEEYEFVSDKKTKNGLPYLHIHLGKTFSTAGAKANGVIAVGNNAKGIISIGLISKGVLSLGVLSIGILSIGVIAIGLLAFGVLALGLAAAGSFAVGLLAVGAFAAGFLAIGAITAGYYSYGALAFGPYTLWSIPAMLLKITIL